MVRRASPGGVGDGLASLPDGEPLLTRWFVLVMIALSIAAVALSVMVFVTRTGSPSAVFPAAERRPPGTATVTHDRGAVVLSETQEEETGTACAPQVRLVGDEGGRATIRRALVALCDELNAVGTADTDLNIVRRGITTLNRERGIIRIALAVATGVDSSTRIVDGVIVIELAPKFQFENSVTATPVLAHELAHVGGDRWPMDAVDVADELEALFVQDVLCRRINFGDEPPRGCSDASEVLGSVDVARALREAGYPG
ncbi:MAG: hypothetical protein ACI970_000755 [Myxococcota bacterium]